MITLDGRMILNLIEDVLIAFNIIFISLWKNLVSIAIVSRSRVVANFYMTGIAIISQKFS